jgi:hypothetical protein
LTPTRAAEIAPPATSQVVFINDAAQNLKERRDALYPINNGQ